MDNLSRVGSWPCMHAKNTIDRMCLPGTNALTYFWLVCKLRIKKELSIQILFPLYLRKQAKIKKFHGLASNWRPSAALMLLFPLIPRFWKSSSQYLKQKLLILFENFKEILENPGACIIKHYGFLIYGKWTEFLVS